MTLVELWEKSQEHFDGKRVQQIISFAGGGGKLVDGGETSTEFRALLQIIPSDILAAYAKECLSGSFEGSGLALQDVINAVGQRLGFTVTPGRYRGVVGAIGFDGLWRSSRGFSIIVEVKTTDAYRVNLETVTGYRLDLIKEHQADEKTSSVLIVVGRDDTGDLEAQIRGSRHARDVRLISVEALLSLLKVKEDTEDPKILQQIADVLAPKDFTRLDGIVDLVFATVTDLSQQDEGGSPIGQTQPRKGAPDLGSEVAFRESCISRIQRRLKRTLIKRSRTLYGTPDGSMLLVCVVSSESKVAGKERYWFGFQAHHAEALKGSAEAFVAFGCGSAKSIVLVPFKEFDDFLEGSWKTEKDGRIWWHVVIEREADKLILRRKTGKAVDLTSFVLSDEA